MKLTSYIDYYNNGLEKQQKVYNDTKDFYNVVLRNINGENFLKFEYKDSPKNYFKDFKIDVLDLGNFRFNFLTDYHELNIINNIIEVSGAKAMILYMNPSFTDMDNLLYVRRVAKEFPKMELIVRFPPTKEGVEIKVFMEGLKIKKSSLYFKPTELYQNKISYRLEYRLLKKYIGFVALCDLDDKDEPILLGYGDLDLIDFFERLYDNVYSGYVALDTNIDIIMKNFDKEERERGAFSGRRSFRYHYEFFHEKIKGNTKYDITMDEIFENQVKVLNDIFKVR